MSYIQDYPLATSLPRIQSPDKLPIGVLELASLVDPTTGRDKLYVLVKQQRYLSILNSYQAGPNNEYFCDQFDFPLKILSWFPRALEEFRKPPAEGGLHAGGMVSKDMNVDGEMLAVGRTTDGYDLTNRSRSDHDSSAYEPMCISFSSEFLYDLGFLALWKNLGAKFELGEI